MKDYWETALPQIPEGVYAETEACCSLCLRLKCAATERPRQATQTSKMEGRGEHLFIFSNEKNLIFCAPYTTVFSGL